MISSLLGKKLGMTQVYDAQNVLVPVTVVEAGPCPVVQVKTVEKEFDDIFGLYVQICYTTADGERYYTTRSADDQTLSALNRQREAAGCKKGEWK